MGLDGPPDLIWMLWRRENSLPLQGIQPRFQCTAFLIHCTGGKQKCLICGVSDTFFVVSVTLIHGCHIAKY